MYVRTCTHLDLVLRWPSHASTHRLPPTCAFKSYFVQAPVASPGAAPAAAPSAAPAGSTVSPVATPTQPLTVEMDVTGELE